MSNPRLPKKQGFWSRLLFGSKPTSSTSSPPVEFTVTATVTKPPPRDRSNSPYAEPEDYPVLPVLALRPWDFGRGLSAPSDGYAFETPDRKIWPVNKCMWKLWDELGILTIRVVGEQFHLADLQDAGFRPLSPIRLVPEPDNPHDPKAISVRDATGTKTAGYIKQGTTGRVRNLIRRNDVSVMAINCLYSDESKTQREDLKIVIFRPGRISNAPKLPLHPDLD